MSLHGFLFVLTLLQSSYPCFTCCWLLESGVFDQSEAGQCVLRTRVRRHWFSWPQARNYWGPCAIKAVQGLIMHQGFSYVLVRVDPCMWWSWSSFVTTSRPCTEPFALEPKTWFCVYKHSTNGGNSIHWKAAKMKSIFFSFLHIKKRDTAEWRTRSHTETQNLKSWSVNALLLQGE